MFSRMEVAFFYLIGVITGLEQFGVKGRAVNISSAWFLPQEGSPVFYRYFSDKITWNEAEAVCSFHHADLLSVQTSGQMDAARAYLKEIDVTDNIWIGLQKESLEKPFSWTNGEKLLGDGYWTEPIPKTNEKLCAAIDPVADFRWNSFYCRGPQLASFVCELPVPEWAKKENGCLITSLPSLTITLLPEVGIIQLLSDCGLEGTRRIACNGGLNREEMIKRLSCDVDAFASTIFGRSTTTDTEREIHTQSSRSETSNTFSAHTRHRRSADSTAENSPGTNSPAKNDKVTSPAFLNIPSHGFPHSPYLASVRNAPSTATPRTNKNNQRTVTKTAEKGNLRPSTAAPPKNTPPLYKDLPVLIITGEKITESNDSVSSATSENPPIVFMIENRDPNEPFLVPLSDDLFINPSLSPGEVLNVDLVEVDNLTTNITTNQTVPIAPEETPSNVHPLKLTEMKKNFLSEISATAKVVTEDSLNNVEEERVLDVPQRPNRGRLLTHSNHPSFYPRFLNRVLG